MWLADPLLCAQAPPSFVSACSNNTRIIIIIIIIIIIGVWFASQRLGIEIFQRGTKKETEPKRQRKGKRETETET